MSSLEESVLGEPDLARSFPDAMSTTALLPVLLEIEAREKLAAHDMRASARAALENGDIVYLPGTCFEPTESERDFISDEARMVRVIRDRKRRGAFPTIVFDPKSGSLQRIRVASAERQVLEAMLYRFSSWACDLVDEMFPSYAGALEQGFATYRPLARRTTQALHIDAAYGRPTRGCGLLRVFCNIDPGGHPRSWQVGEAFEPFAERFVPVARDVAAAPNHWLDRFRRSRWQRTPYDRLLGSLHDVVMGDAGYQKTAQRKWVEFSSGSSWVTITDRLIHGADCGQHCLDQLFFLPPDAMLDPSRSSLNVLERLMGRTLV